MIVIVVIKASQGQQVRSSWLQQAYQCQL